MTSKHDVVSDLVEDAARQVAATINHVLHAALDQGTSRVTGAGPAHGPGRALLRTLSEEFAEFARDWREAKARELLETAALSFLDWSDRFTRDGLEGLTAPPKVEPQACLPEIPRATVNGRLRPASPLRGGLGT